MKMNVIAIAIMGALSTLSINAQAGCSDKLSVDSMVECITIEGDGSTNYEAHMEKSGLPIYYKSYKNKEVTEGIGESIATNSD